MWSVKKPCKETFFYPSPESQKQLQNSKRIFGWDYSTCPAIVKYVPSPRSSFFNIALMFLPGSYERTIRVVREHSSVRIKADGQTHIQPISLIPRLFRPFSSTFRQFNRLVGPLPTTLREIRFQPFSRGRAIKSHIMYNAKVISSQRGKYEIFSIFQGPKVL